MFKGLGENTTIEQLTGSPNTSDIELRKAVDDQWTNVLRWLRSFDQLRDAAHSSGLTARMTAP
jgi:hypothetical protein